MIRRKVGRQIKYCMWKGKKEVVKGSKQTDEMICFYQSDPTRRGHQKQVIGF